MHYILTRRLARDGASYKFVHNLSRIRSFEHFREKRGMRHVTDLREGCKRKARKRILYIRLPTLYEALATNSTSVAQVALRRREECERKNATLREKCSYTRFKSKQTSMMSDDGICSNARNATFDCLVCPTLRRSLRRRPRCAKSALF